MCGMPQTRNKKQKPKAPPIDPALLPFLDELAAMIAARLLAEHRARKERAS